MTNDLTAAVEDALDSIEKTRKNYPESHTVMAITEKTLMPLIKAAQIVEDLAKTLEFIIEQTSDPQNATHALGSWIHGVGFNRAKEQLTALNALIEGGGDD